MSYGLKILVHWSSVCLPVCIGYMTVTLFFRIKSQIWQVGGITVLHQTVVRQKEQVFLGKGRHCDVSN